MSTTGMRRGVGGGFQVGRRRHVPVVDSGCGCRPRRPRLLSSLPSFLKPSAMSKAARAGAGAAAGSSGFFFPSSCSAASFSSSSAATYTTSYSSSNCSNVNYYYSSHGYGDGVAKQQQQQKLDPPAKVPPAPSPVKRQQPSKTKKKKKKYYVEKATAAAKREEEEEDVGVAVEKESSDPRADFRDSMVQMVVETGLCGWDDLRCMLRRLLALNAPSHHAAILTAFAEVCAQLAAPPTPPYHQYQYNH